MAEFLDPEYAQTTGNPDASLQDWLNDPASAQWVKDQAKAHAAALLGFSDPYGNNIDPNSGMPSNPSFTYVMDKGPATGVTPSGSTPPPKEDTITTPGVSSLDPTEAQSVPLPQERPPEAGPGAGDISARKKNPEDKSTESDFAKMMAGVKALQPPPVNPVGTPSVRSPSAINAPNLSQILQLLGASSRPDPLQTLGRLLVAGKA